MPCSTRPWRQAPGLVDPVAMSPSGSLTDQLPAGIQAALRQIVLALAGLICVVLAIAATGMALESFGRGDVDVRSIDLPRWLLFAPLAAGFALLAAEFFRLLILGDPVTEGPGEGF